MLNEHFRDSVLLVKIADFSPPETSQAPKFLLQNVIKITDFSDFGEFLGQSLPLVPPDFPASCRPASSTQEEGNLSNASREDVSVIREGLRYNVKITLILTLR